MNRKYSWATRLLPLFIFMLFTGIILYPISIFPNSFVLGRPFDDVFEAIGYLGWYKRAIFDLNTSPLFQPDIFYPDGWHLIFAPIPPVFPILASPFVAMLGPVITYNLILIGSTIVAACGAYKFSRLLGSGFWGGILAGLLYAFYPNRQVYMNGFFNFLIASAWLPWMLFSLLKAYKTPQKRVLWLALVGLFFSLGIVAAYQYVYINSISLIVFGVVLLFSDIRNNWQDWKKPLFTMMGVILFIAVPILLTGYVAQRKTGVVMEFSLQNLISTSVSLERFFVPSAKNPLFTTLATVVFPLREGEDSLVSFGLITLILVVVWFIMSKSRSQSEKATALLALVSVLFMLGPFLKLHGQLVTLDLSIAKKLGDLFPFMTSDTGVRIPMPALLIYYLIPPLRTFHHFGRIGMVAILCFGSLAGLGLTLLLNKARTSKVLHSILLIGVFSLFIVEFNMQPHTDVTAIAGMQREVDVWLANQTSQQIILEYPLSLTAKGPSLYFYLYHNQKMIHGYSPMVSSTFSFARPLLEQWPNETAVSQIIDLSVDYVLIHVNNEEQFRVNSLPQIEEIPVLEFVGIFPIANMPEEDSYLFFDMIKVKSYPASTTYVFKTID